MESDAPRPLRRTLGRSARAKELLAEARKEHEMASMGEPQEGEKEPIFVDRPSLEDATTTYAIPPDQYRAEMRAKVWRESTENKLDETVPGGRYLVDGKLVDCNGNPVKE